MFGKMAKTMLAAAMAASLLAGCGGAGSKDQAGGSEAGAGKSAPPASNEPVTVSIVMHQGYFKDQEVQKYFIDPVKKKHPNITIDFKETGKGNEFADFVARNEIPDIFMESIANMGFLEDLGLAFNMEPLIKQHNFDLARYQKGTVYVLRSLSSKKEINMIAYNRPFFVLYYDKDIFDKFATPYPKDGMTWDDAREVAKKVTRM
ncbi:MAG: transporter substrate-binding protein, partial [Paenibacillaceae bacterium]|nr:transporter substrate-binding protein [Paenibacillaceae bacterium]